MELHRIQTCQLFDTRKTTDNINIGRRPLPDFGQIRRAAGCGNDGNQAPRYGCRSRQSAVLRWSGHRKCTQLGGLVDNSADHQRLRCTTLGERLRRSGWRIGLSDSASTAHQGGGKPCGGRVHRGRYAPFSWSTSPLGAGIRIHCRTTGLVATSVWIMRLCSALHQTPACAWRCDPWSATPFEHLPKPTSSGDLLDYHR